MIMNCTSYFYENFNLFCFFVHENCQTCYFWPAYCRFSPPCIVATEVGAHLSFVQRRVKTDRPMTCVRSKTYIDTIRVLPWNR